LTGSDDVEAELQREYQLMMGGEGEDGEGPIHPSNPLLAADEEELDAQLKSFERIMEQMKRTREMTARGQVSDADRKRIAEQMLVQLLEQVDSFGLGADLGEDMLGTKGLSLGAGDDDDEDGGAAGGTGDQDEKQSGSSK